MKRVELLTLRHPRLAKHQKLRCIARLRPRPVLVLVRPHPPTGKRVRDAVPIILMAACVGVPIS